MKKLTLLLVCLAIIIGNAYSQTKNPFKLNYDSKGGFNGGITYNAMPYANIYLGADFLLKNQSIIEVNYGLVFNANKTNYNTVNNIGYNNYGLFIEGNYVLKNGLYLGILFQKDLSYTYTIDRIKYKQQTNEELADWMNGNSILFQLGYRKEIKPRLGFRAQLQGGFRNYIVEVKNIRQEMYNNDFIATCNIGLYYMFTKRNYTKE